METGEEITVKRLWCIFIVGVPWKKKKKKKKKNKGFLQPRVSFRRKKGERNKREEKQLQCCNSFIYVTNRNEEQIWQQLLFHLSS